MKKSFPCVSSSWVMCLPGVCALMHLATSGSESPLFFLLHIAYDLKDFSAKSSLFVLASCDSARYISACKATGRETQLHWTGEHRGAGVLGL